MEPRKRLTQAQRKNWEKHKYFLTLKGWNGKQQPDPNPRFSERRRSERKLKPRASKRWMD